MEEATVIDGRYRRERELGRHGSAVTWLVTDLERARLCTAKEFLLGRARPTESLERFQERAGILSHLRHAGIPAFIALSCREEGAEIRCLLIQEFVEGESLARLVGGGKHFTEEQTYAWLSQAASVLRYLHRFSPPLVHRNIKPTNLIFGADGALRLTDFEFTSRPLSEEPLPAPDAEALTSGYTPPEALAGSWTPAADVFSLGMCAIYALSRREPPFLGLERKPYEFRPAVNISDGLARILERMVDPDPARRFRNGQELKDALPLWAERVRKPGGRWFPWPLLTAAAVALIAGWVLLLQPRLPRPSGEVLAPSAPPPAEAPRGKIAAAPPELSTEKPVYASGEPITVTFGGFPGNRGDWITVTAATAGNRSYAEWHYTKGERQGQRTFKGLSPGNYEVRAYYDWPTGDYEIQGRFPFQVAAAPLPPEAPFSGPVVEGRLLFEGRPVWDVSRKRPVFWFRNERQNVAESPAVEYDEGRFRIRGLSAGEIGMSIRIDLDPENPPVYPGDLDVWTIIRVPEGGSVDVEAQMSKIIRLREPRDNGAIIPGWDLECGRGSSLASPVTFRWEPLGADLDYAVRIERMNCRDGYRSSGTAYEATTRELALTVPLAPSNPEECYAFHLSARRGDLPVGIFTTHGDHGLGWDLRFTVAP